MHIKAILSQHRRDFTALYECGHCGHTHDDDHFHQNVVPGRACPQCGKNGGTTPKYPEGMQI